MHDLKVDRLSGSLDGVRVSVIVSGSIGAMESPRLIRALRRLGAEVEPFLTRGGSQFITSTSISWAAARECTMEFSGTSTHLATGDFCVVAPASANFIHKIATGQTDTPAAALLASYLGQKKPVILVPSMHDSLFHSPFVQENWRKISGVLTRLEPRKEEGKQKFPEPALLADEISHEFNRQARVDKSLLVSMGTTRGYIDDVRYLSNYSSGALGTAILHEAYRRGVKTRAVVGPCKVEPKVYTELARIETNEQLEVACQNAISAGCDGAVLAASVLDFVPENRLSGKVSSSGELEVSFSRTQKIISKISLATGKKVGFKLEADLPMAKAHAIAKDYINKYDLSMIVINALKDVNQKDHRALIFTREQGFLGYREGKQPLAEHIVDHIIH